MNRTFVFFAVLGAATAARATEQTNGTQMNGTQMNGTQMNGVSFNGTQMNGTQMNGVALSGSWLSGTIPCSTGTCSVGATQMIGATFTANTASGPMTIRLDDVKLAPNDPENDVWLYRFTWREVIWRYVYGRWYGIVTWQPLCPSTDRDGNYNYAIPVAGQWNDCQGAGCGGKSSPDGFALGCTDVGAIAKCVQRYGYKPWKWVPERYGRYASHYQSLEPYHEACVRMVRADYCGDGTPHTASTGITYIDAWDWPGVETPTPNINFGFEASWTPHGAYCISVSRFQYLGGTLGGTAAALANCPWLTPPANDPCPANNGYIAPSTGPWPSGFINWNHPAYIANSSSQTLIQ